MNYKIDRNGAKSWYNDKGLLHRLDGPAYEDINCNKKWWVNGLLHRLDGPAVEYHDGDKEWYIDGILYTHDSLLEFLLK